LKTPGAFDFPGFLFILLEFELNNDGVVGRAETIGKGLRETWGGANGLFDGRIHSGIT
jgi:hypothetical protein